MNPVLFDRRAEEELSQSALYYEAQEKGLGLQFLLAVEFAIKEAASNPHIFSATTKGCRKCRVVRFPYAIIFRERNEEIQIIAVMHLKRKPNYWNVRIQ